MYKDGTLENSFREKKKLEQKVIEQKKKLWLKRF